MPGYTILVLDANILLSSLSMVASLVESLRWTIVSPPCNHGADRLASNATALGDAAKAAIEFVASTQSANIPGQSLVVIERARGAGRPIRDNSALLELLGERPNSQRVM